MQVLFIARSADASVLRETVERRVRFVLCRASGLVQRARVQLSDVNGPRGGVDKSCQVELTTDGAGSVVVTAQDTDWHIALDRALARASRALARLWDRRHDTQRSWSHALKPPDTTTV